MIQEKIYDYFTRNPHLRVLFVFDSFGLKENELDEKTWKDDYLYVKFDGGWFKTKYAIENDWKDKKIILLFPECKSPLGSQQTMLEFPLMDVLAANMEYKEDDYSAFVQQNHIQGEMAPYVQRHLAELQQQKTIKIIGPYYGTADFTMDVANRGLLSLYLGSEKLLDWDNIIIRLIVLDANNRMDEVMKGLNRNADVLKALDKKLKQIFGASIELNNPSAKMKSVAESLKYNALTQMFAAHPFDDYKKLKITGEQPLQILNRIVETPLPKQQREQFNDAIGRLASRIQESVIIKYYGVNANYAIITPELAFPILSEMIGKLKIEPDTVIDCMRQLGQKIGENENVMQSVRLVSLLAKYYQSERNFGTLKLNTPSSYIERYVDEFSSIDNCYRHILEEFYGLNPETPNYEKLQMEKKTVDLDYASLCNEFNMEWLRCVTETKTVINQLEKPIQQCRFYKEYRNKDVKQVVIISDALRYEVAKDLLLELSKEKHYATLEYMIAGLPTETKFCKNALLPHKTLSLSDADMMVDGNDLVSLDQRTAHVNVHINDACCVNFKDVEGASRDANRELFKRPLVYIYHNTIDEAGHTNNPLDVIDACKRSITQIAKLVKSLHSSFNVANVIVTSDHGFLYNDIPFTEKDKHSIDENAIEKKTRYYLTPSDAVVFGITKFKLNEVSEMQEVMNVAIPTGTNRLAAAGGYQFAHGGASLQEMIVPVIVSKGKKDDVKGKVSVKLMSRNLSVVASRLQFKLVQAEAVSMDLQALTIKFALYDKDELVTAEKTMTLDSTDAEDADNRVFDADLILNKETSASVFQLRIYDSEDPLNPLVKENVKNNTLIERDF